MSLQFGIAFCEASGPRLLRFDGNNDELVELAKQNALSVGCGHSFFIFIKNGFPINILNQIKNTMEVCQIFCATANPTEVIVAKTASGRGVMGVVDGQPPLGVEDENEIIKRKSFLQNITKYKR